MAEPVRDPVPVDAIRAELTSERFVRSFRGIEIYATDAHACPNLMQEIGRVREVEFRSEGGGTGHAVDIDEFDTAADPFRQLVAWDPDAGELVGMYRFFPGSHAVAADGSVALPTSRLFDFSSRFRSDYLPLTIELGRSVVNRSARRAIVGLFAVWSGLGAMVAEHPECRYFFGKFTTFPSYHPDALRALNAFLAAYCPDPDSLVTPRAELALEPSSVDDDLFTGTDYDADYERLGEIARSVGEMIPPLVISYLGLSRTMRAFGTARNPHFGNVLETAILVDIHDIAAKQRTRFVESYEPTGRGALAWSTPESPPSTP